MKCVWLLATAGMLWAQADDAILRAMREELARSKSLRVVAPEKPYYFEYALDDVEMMNIHGSLGALVQQRKNHLRIPRVQVRVGDYAFDNTNHIYSDFFTGSRYSPEQFPLDDNLDVLRMSFWLATDAAYKQALEGIGRKKASLQNVNQTEQMPDFSKAEPTKMLLPSPRVNIDAASWRSRVKELSAIFLKYPNIIDSSVEVEASQSVSYVINSEGTELKLPDHLGFVRIKANGQAPDGMTIRDHAVLESLDPTRLPGDAELRRRATEVADNVTALQKAPIGESYSGPVLFEPLAAAQWFAELLGRNLVIQRRPVADPNRNVPVPSSELEGRIGSRIVPEWMDVVDDPTQTEWHGTPLFGSYPVDMEGVIPKPVTLIEKGVLQTYLLTRQPVKGFGSSNGRARIPGNFGAKQALMSNLFVKASQTVPAAELKRKLVAMLVQRNKPYGLLVRKTDYPSSAGIGEIRALANSAGQTSRPMALPLLVYKVYPDGREELVRGLRFRGVNVRTLRDIVAAGDEQVVFDYLENGAPFAMMGAGGYVAGCTVVAPGLLFEDLELERMQGEQPKLPLVPPPALTASR